MKPMALKILLLLLVGTIAGFLNVLAGGGSFLTLPMLIFMGLPPTVANGTNRVAILMQNTVAVKKFHEFRVFPLKFSLLVTIPAVIGSLVGAYTATIIPDATFKRVLALIMMAITLATMMNPTEKLSSRSSRERTRGMGQWTAIVLMFLVIGFYGGFVQAGVGFLILSAMVVAGFDLIHGNAVKVFVILIFTLFALVIFTIQGKVNYLWGAILGLGNVTGAYLATVTAVRKGNRFVQRVVFVAIVIMAIKLLMG